jgi:hypothetical protein
MLKTLAVGTRSLGRVPSGCRQGCNTLSFWDAAPLVGVAALSKGGYVSSNSVSSNSSQPTRTQSQIEADLGATRDRLAASVAALIDQVHPNRIKQRQIANVKQFANTELENAKSKIFNARGDLRTNRIVGVAAAVAGVVGFLLIIRAIVRRGSSD